MTKHEDLLYINHILDAIKDVEESLNRKLYEEEFFN